MENRVNIGSDDKLSSLQAVLSPTSSTVSTVPSSHSSSSLSSNNSFNLISNPSSSGQQQLNHAALVVPESLEMIQKASSFSSVRHRWNTNEEIASILIAFDRHEEWLSKEVTVRPKSSSMILYSRKRVRYRRDGYCWKKRKDGKTTREDHMKLKVQGTECIYGCYVHSAILPTFHRRCYWLLQNPDIVLVHYLNVPFTDDNKVNIHTIVSNGSILADSKKEWTRQDLLEELKPMFFTESDITTLSSDMMNDQLTANSVESTIEGIIDQLMNRLQQQQANCVKDTLMETSLMSGEVNSGGAGSSSRPGFSRELTDGNHGVSSHNHYPKSKDLSLSLKTTTKPSSSSSSYIPRNLMNLSSNGFSNSRTTSSSRPSSALNHSQQPPPLILNLSQLSNNSSRLLILNNNSVSSPTSMSMTSPAQTTTSILSPNSNTCSSTSSIDAMNSNGDGSSNCSKSSSQVHHQHNQHVFKSNALLSLASNRVEQQEDNVSMDFMEADLTTNGSDDDLFNLETFEMLTDSFPNCLDDNFNDGLTHQGDQLDNHSNLTGNSNSSNFGQQQHQNTQSSVTSDLFNNNNQNDSSPTTQCDQNHHSMVMSMNGNQIQNRNLLSNMDNDPRTSIISIVSNPTTTLTITDYSPDWSYPEGGIKVLVAGPWFLTPSSGKGQSSMNYSIKNQINMNSMNNNNNNNRFNNNSNQVTCKYSIIFDGVSVESDLIQNGVLRCFSPAHEAGFVSLQVALDGNPVSNSVIFEYRDHQSTPAIVQDYFAVDDNVFKFCLLERLESMETHVESSPLNHQMRRNGIQEKRDVITDEASSFESRLLTMMTRVMFRPWLPVNVTSMTTQGLRKGFNRPDMSLLHFAAALGYTRLIAALIQWRINNPCIILEVEVDPFSCDSNDCTPLMWCLSKGHRDASVLLSKWSRQSLNLCDKQGVSPMESAKKRAFNDLVSDIEDIKRKQPCEEFQTVLDNILGSVPLESRDVISKNIQEESEDENEESFFGQKRTMMISGKCNQARGQRPMVLHSQKTLPLGKSYLHQDHHQQSNVLRCHQRQQSQSLEEDSSSSCEKTRGKFVAISLHQQQKEDTVNHSSCLCFFKNRNEGKQQQLRLHSQSKSTGKSIDQEQDHIFTHPYPPSRSDHLTSSGGQVLSSLGFDPDSYDSMDDSNGEEEDAVDHDHCQSECQGRSCLRLRRNQRKNRSSRLLPSFQQSQRNKHSSCLIFSEDEIDDEEEERKSVKSEVVDTAPKKSFRNSRTSNDDHLLDSHSSSSSCCSEDMMMSSPSPGDLTLNLESSEQVLSFAEHIIAAISERIKDTGRSNMSRNCQHHQRRRESSSSGNSSSANSVSSSCPSTPMTPMSLHSLSSSFETASGVLSNHSNDLSSCQQHRQGRNTSCSSGNATHYPVKGNQIVNNRSLNESPLNYNNTSSPTMNDVQENHGSPASNVSSVSSRALFMQKFSSLTLSDQEQRELYQAARTIQKAYRGYQMRKSSLASNSSSLSSSSSLLTNQGQSTHNCQSSITQINASSNSNTGQRHHHHYRRHKSELPKRSPSTITTEEEKAAATLIQSYYRRYKQYVYYKQMTKAAQVIQNQFRNYCSKRFKTNLNVSTTSAASSSGYSSSGRKTSSVSSPVSSVNKLVMHNNINSNSNKGRSPSIQISSSLSSSMMSSCSSSCSNSRKGSTTSCSENPQQNQESSSSANGNGLKRTYSQRRQHQAARKIQQFLRQSKNKLQKARNAATEETTITTSTTMVVTSPRKTSRECHPLHSSDVLPPRVEGHHHQTQHLHQVPDSRHPSMDSSNKTLSVVEFDRTVNATTPALNPKEIAKRNEKKIPFLHDS